MNLYTPEYFKPWEFVPRAIYEIMGKDSLLLIKPITLITADDLRRYFGVPITINNYMISGTNEFRGFRPAYCQIGAPNSEHRNGGAFDCDIEGVSAENARKEILAHTSKFPYLKRLEDGVNWVHADVKEIDMEGILLFKS
jgi:hypothetical protein